MEIYSVRVEEPEIKGYPIKDLLDHKAPSAAIFTALPILLEVSAVQGAQDSVDLEKRIAFAKR